MAARSGSGAVRDAVRAVRYHEQLSGGDSWGWAAVSDGELIYETGMGYVPNELSVPEKAADAQLAIAHTRAATCGKVTKKNAHPFPIEDRNGEEVAALCHNGTWQEAPVDHNSERCDSYYIARDLEERLIDLEDDFAVESPVEQAVMETGNHVGETFLLIHRDGRVFAYSGRYKITMQGDAIQSSGFGRIPTGKIECLTKPTDQSHVTNWM